MSSQLFVQVQISNQTVLFVLQATSGATRNKENLVETDVVNVGLILSNVSVLKTFQQNVNINIIFQFPPVTYLLGFLGCRKRCGDCKQHS